MKEYIRTHTKADFGTRYSERDYPPLVAEKLANQLKISSLEQINVIFAKAWDWFLAFQTELNTQFSHLFSPGI